MYKEAIKNSENIFLAILWYAVACFDEWETNNLLLE